MFSIDFLQAVNDWQLGGNAKQKKKRAEKLKELSKNIDARFREAHLCCFRQISLDKKNLWELLAENCLPETISAWTSDSKVAKEFKGGVPPVGWQGVIFVLSPSSETVVLNLAALYSNKDFKNSIQTYKDQIDRFSEGIARYGASQCEVVLEVKSLDAARVYALGGFSSGEFELAHQYYGHPPSDQEMESFRHLLNNTGEKLGPTWLEGESLDRVLRRMQPQIERLKEIKELQNKTNS